VCRAEPIANTRTVAWALKMLKGQALRESRPRNAKTRLRLNRGQGSNRLGEPDVWSYVLQPYRLVKDAAHLTLQNRKGNVPTRSSTASRTIIEPSLGGRPGQLTKGGVAEDLDA